MMSIFIQQKTSPPFHDVKCALISVFLSLNLIFVEFVILQCLCYTLNVVTI